MHRILIIQTAFIGDVILATALVEKLKKFYPEAEIDFLVRKGNENLLDNNPKLNKILIWKKKQQKIRNLFNLIWDIRKNNYDWVINCHRFFSSGLFTACSGAKLTTGFSKNPLAFTFHENYKHTIGNGIHEVSRNNQLIASKTDSNTNKPVLYPSKEDFKKVSKYKNHPYLCIAPTSVWYTKQFPFEKWMEFLKALEFAGNIYLLGGPEDFEHCGYLSLESGKYNIYNLAGTLTLLQSAALMQDALINYVNDSAPLHLASAVNAKTCAIFCSTVPSFGFGPLADFSVIIEEQSGLDCRPCGLHGYQECPQGHFRCGYDIDVHRMVRVLDRARLEP